MSSIRPKRTEPEIVAVVRKPYVPLTIFAFYGFRCSVVAMTVYGMTFAIKGPERSKILRTHMEVLVEPKISVLVANDFPMIRKSMRELLNDTPNVRVIACTEAKSEVLPLADAHRPQVTILDLEVEWNALADLVTGLSDRKVPVLVMSDKFDDVKTFELLKNGANGVISRKIDPELLCRSVRAVASGEIWVSRAVVGQLVNKLRITPADMLLRPDDKREASASPDFTAQVQLRSRFGLTPRESEMVRAIGDAMTNKDIATHFGISEYTVKHHLTKIFDKVGVYSRLELAMFATHHGLVEKSPVAVA